MWVLDLVDVRPVQLDVRYPAFTGKRVLLFRQHPVARCGHAPLARLGLRL
jgi:hypothetical protein